MAPEAELSRRSPFVAVDSLVRAMGNKNSPKPNQNTSQQPSRQQQEEELVDLEGEEACISYLILISIVESPSHNLWPFSFSFAVGGRNDIVLTPFCNETEWEEKVKKLSRAEALREGEVELETTATSVAAKTLCIPHDQVICGRKRNGSWLTQRPAACKACLDCRGTR